MKRLFIIIISIFLCMSFTMLGAACSSPSEDIVPETPDEPKEEIIIKPSDLPTTADVKVEDVSIGSDIWETPNIPTPAKLIKGVEKSEINLNETSGNGVWKYLFNIPNYTSSDGVPFPTESNQNFDFDKWNSLEWRNIKVPGEPLMQGFDILSNNEYYYKRTIAVPKDFANNQILVRFDGVYSNARVWVNGNYIRTHVGGFTTWDCDITEFAVAGEGVTLIVGVTDIYSNTLGIWNPEGKFLNNPAGASDYAHHNIGGILRDVSLIALPKDSIVRTYINTELDKNFINAKLEVTTQLNLVSENATLVLELFDDKNMVASAKTEFSKPENTNITKAKKITIPIINPKKWDAEHPNLYTLKSYLMHDETGILLNEEKIGFREIHYGAKDGSDRNKIYVNGNEIKLRGTCRHDVSSDLGRSMTREQSYAEIRAYKNANINHIRTSHYPASQDILDACDEMGIYVEQETAVCFQGYPSSTVSSKYEDYLPQFTEMIERDRNRPSILIWSLGNETNYESVKNQSGGNAIGDEKAYLKDVDNSRPCIFSWPDTAPYEIADIYSKHYADVSSGSLGAWDRPVLHDEYAHVSCYNLDELQRDMNVRNFWGASVKKAWENIFTTDGALGGALWGGIDDVFYIPEETTERWQSHSEGQTAGYGEWGSVLDAYLREKPEAYLTKKAYSPIRIDEKKCYVLDGELRIPVKNWFDHTNLNELTVLVSYDKNENRVGIGESVLPHSNGEISVPFAPKTPVKRVNLKFYTADGYMVDEYNVEIGENLYNFTAASKTPPTISQTSSSILVKGEDFSVAFSKASGLITSAKYKDNLLITGGPYLHITGSELGKWNQSTKNKIDAKISSNYAEISINGNYENGQEVSFNVKISGNGIIKTNYRLTNTPTTQWGLREVGISYDIPNSVDNVNWVRRGLYSAYPDDHIGRNEGTAYRMRDNSDKISDEYGKMPEWSWKDDMKNYYIYSTDDPRNGLATNDFKTMRENIRYYNVNFSRANDAAFISVESLDESVAARVDVSYDRTVIDDRHSSIKYSSGWSKYETSTDYGGTEHYSTKRGASCEFEFEGTGVRYIGSKQGNTGLVKIYIDNEFVKTVDTYSNLGNEMKQSIIYSVNGLKNGKHKIKLETAGGNADSIVVDAFEVLKSVNTSEFLKMKLIINNQWYYPNLGWGNYVGTEGNIHEGSTGQVSLRLTSSNNYIEHGKVLLSDPKLKNTTDNKVKVEFNLESNDENAKTNIRWFKIAEGDPSSKATEILGENNNTISVAALKGYKVYCIVDVTISGAEVLSKKSDIISTGASFYKYYDIIAESNLFKFVGTKGKDYQTDFDKDWTQNAYQKTVTYLLESEKNSSITFKFTGCGIRWIGAKESNQGIASIIIDNEEPIELDLYSGVASQEQINEILYEKLWNSSGEHTIIIQRTGKKNPASLQSNISLDAFIVLV